ncbi:hypothetical protein GG804_18390 [Sphingomonas histidinilytica]|uniref:hypothetical protein n=1 Tax=Sphingomonadales TaxID=204457 RepID=UPI000834F944|nr:MULTISPECIES: hypothetical protein [Sphingomonadaceae]MBO9378742.1 hypothetical protein [Rhizorhabdus histidinilytica]
MMIIAARNAAASLLMARQRGPGSIFGKHEKQTGEPAAAQDVHRPSVWLIHCFHGCPTSGFAHQRADASLN